MSTKTIFAFAAAIAAILVLVPPAKASEIEWAHATIGAIERDMGAVHRDADHFYGEMNRAHSTLQWHAWMERTRVEQMNRAGCGQPPNQGAWAYCMGLYNDLQAHVRWRQHLAGIVEQSRARHLAAVQQLDELGRVGNLWRTHLAALTGGNSNFAAGQGGERTVTGSINGGQWSRVAR